MDAVEHLHERSRSDRSPSSAKTASPAAFRRSNAAGRPRAGRSSWAIVPLNNQPWRGSSRAVARAGGILGHRRLRDELIQHLDALSRWTWPRLALLGAASSVTLCWSCAGTRPVGAGAAPGDRDAVVLFNLTTAATLGLAVASSTPACSRSVSWAGAGVIPPSVYHSSVGPTPAVTDYLKLASWLAATIVQTAGSSSPRLASSDERRGDPRGGPHRHLPDVNAR